MKFGIYRSLICEIVRSTGCKKYLELGVCRGELLQMVDKFCSDITGVDIIDNRAHKIGKFFHMKTEDFFKQNKETFDIIFIDASHKIEDVVNDLKNSVNVLNPNGIILIHDTDPANDSLINENGDFCGDAVKLNFMHFENLSFVTMPVGDEGITVIRRKKETRAGGNYYE
jgi:hypothetical protein